MAVNKLPLVINFKSTHDRQKAKPGGSSIKINKDMQRQVLTPKFEALTNIYQETDNHVLVFEILGNISNLQDAVDKNSDIQWLYRDNSKDNELKIKDHRLLEGIQIGSEFFYIKKDENILISKDESRDIVLELENKGFLKDRKPLSFKEKFLKKEILEKKIKPSIKDSLKDVYKTELAMKKIFERLQTYKGEFLYINSNKKMLEKVKVGFKNWCNGQPNTELKHWSSIFSQLYDVRHWDSNDRIPDDTEKKFQNYLKLVKGHANDKHTIVIELWFTDDSQKRAQNKKKVEEELSQNGGLVVGEYINKNIRFFGLKVKVSSSYLEDIKVKNISSFSEIRYIYPIPQATFNSLSSLSEGNEIEINENLKPAILALFDGLPIQNHPYLKNHIQVDDIHGYDNGQYQSNWREHGTSMASLIINGDLNNSEVKQTSRKVHVVPIMKGLTSEEKEGFEEDRFLEDIIHESVKHLTDKHPNIKIVNLSIGDSTKPFATRLSPLARLLDWLSFYYGILFLVSAGNNKSSFNNASSFQNSTDKNLEVFKLLKENSSRRGIISPAESINGVTVGALHSDFSETNLESPDQLDILSDSSLPSPISSLGLGYNRSIKPEIFFPGGRQLYKVKDNKLEVLDQNNKGIKVASSSISKKTYNTVGTSNATALASRASCDIYDMLEKIFTTTDKKEYFPLLIKTLLVHGAKKPPASIKLVRKVASAKENQAKYLGYGNSEVSHVITCTEHRVTMIGCGKIKRSSSESGNNYQQFHIKIPEELLGKKVNLIVTLSYFSHIDSRNIAYRKAEVIFETKLNGNWDKENNDLQIKRGTIQHQIYTGTVERQLIDEGIPITVQYKEKGQEQKNEIKFALAVTLEAHEEIGIDLYEKIQEHIQVEEQQEEIHMT